MVWKSVYQILEEVLKGKQNKVQTQTQTQTQNNNYLVKFSMSYKENGAKVFKFAIKSKSRPGLIHRVIIAVKDNHYIMTGCDCEGYRYHRHCWHVDFADKFIKRHNLW